MKLLFPGVILLLSSCTSYPFQLQYQPFKVQSLNPNLSECTAVQRNDRFIAVLSGRDWNLKDTCK